MSAELAILLVVAVLLLLLAFETPVAYCLVIAGTFGLILLHGFKYASSTLGGVPFTSTNSFTLTVLPTFILIGIFAVAGNIARQIFAISTYLFRKVPGGLGAATVMACAGFAAVSGSSVATSATMARLSVGEMIKYGYRPRFASGLVAAAGTLGVMIPPSVILVLYAVITGESPAALLAAGIVPGLVTGTSYMAYVLVRARKMTDLRADELAAVVTSTVRDADTSVLRNRKAATSASAAGSEIRLRELPWRGVVRIGIIFGIILGGIYSGVFTVTESGAIGALAAGVMMIWERRKGGIRRVWQAVQRAFWETASTTSMVFAIVIGSGIFSVFLVSSGAPRRLAEFVGDLELPAPVVVAVFLLILIPLGMGLESLAILLITMPLMYPIVIDLGYDGVWFGILVTILIEVGLITPPVGLSTYVVSGTAKVKVEEVFAGIWPFVGIQLLLAALIFVFPEIVLWLPSMLNQ